MGGERGHGGRDGGYSWLPQSQAEYDSERAERFQEGAMRLPLVRDSPAALISPSAEWGEQPPTRGAHWELGEKPEH